MFKSDDFNLSLEQELKLRVVNDEIDNCTSVESLQKELKSATTLLMKYQKIINTLVKNQITRDLADFGLIVEERGLK
jgi:hypothetical protein